jgi:hypothetical protein
MVNLPTFRTADPRWGDGQGSDLAAVTIDLSFWGLYAAILALEGSQQTLSEIDYFVPVGNQLFVHMTDHRVLGPITIPTANWNYRSGGWQPLTLYAAFDVFSFNGSVYLVLAAHTSAATFSANATDGLTHNLYGLLITSPDNTLPDNGTIGQRLAKLSGSPFITGWVSDKIRMALFVEGQPLAGEKLMQYLVVDHMTLPTGLIGSVAFAATPTLSNVQYTISLNGAPLGTIDFSGPSPETVTVSFTADIALIPGDIITVTAPTTPDTQQADISIVLVALLTE